MAPMRGHIEKRGDRTYRLEVELGRDDNGRRQRVRRTFHGTKREAEAELNKLLGDVGIVNGSAGAKPIDEVVDVYLRRVKAGKYADDCRYAWDLVPDAFKARRIGTLTPGDFEDLYDELADRVDDDGEPAPVSPWRIRRIHNTARTALNLAARRRWIASNPATLAQPPRTERRTPRPPSRDAVAALVEAADDDLLLWIRVASTTGARRGEVAGLRWSDIDREAATVTISRAVSYAKSTGVVVGPTKTENVRRVAIGMRLLGELEDVRDARRALAEEYLGGWDDDRYLFASDPEGRTPWRPDRASRQFRKLRDRLGLGREVRLKELRHYVATELIGAGVDIVTVAGRLGHASPAMTANVYASALAARDRDAAAILD